MIKREQIARLGILIATVAAVAFVQPASAATCNVPSAPHPTIQAAVDDIGCAPIVIAAGTYSGSVVIARSVNLTGAGSDQTFVQGQVQVNSGTVHLAGLHLTAPNDALWRTRGPRSRVSTSRWSTMRSPKPRSSPTVSNRGERERGRRFRRDNS